MRLVDEMLYRINEPCTAKQCSFYCFFIEVILPTNMAALQRFVHDNAKHQCL